MLQFEQCIYLNIKCLTRKLEKWVHISLCLSIHLYPLSHTHTKSMCSIAFFLIYSPFNESICFIKKLLKYQPPISPVHSSVSTTTTAKTTTTTTTIITTSTTKSSIYFQQSILPVSRSLGKTIFQFSQSSFTIEN